MRRQRHSRGENAAAHRLLTPAALLLILTACGAPDQKVEPEGDGPPEERPYVVDFGTVEVGGAPARASIPLHNGGPSLVELAIDLPLPPFHLDGPSTRSIEPGATEALDFRFAPDAPISYEAEATLELGDRKTRILFFGQGAMPALVCTSRLDFGLHPSGATVEREAECVNTSDAPLEVQVTDLRGHHRDSFEVELVQVTLAPQATLAIPVRFRPAYSVVRTAFLDVITETGRETIELVGQSTLEALEVEGSCADGGADFGTVAPGDTARRTLTLRNVTETPVEVDRLQLFGEDEAHFHVLTAVPLTIGVDDPSTEVREDEAQVEIEFRPDDYGAHSARLFVGTTVSTVTMEACLIGRSSVAALTCASDRFEFGKVAVGVPRTRSIGCTNGGEGGNLEIHDVELDDASLQLTIRNPDGSVGSPPEGYAPGEAFTLELTWDPAEAGTLDVLLHLHTNQIDPTPAFPITGEALDLAPCTSIVFPEELHFGRVLPGQQMQLDVLVESGPESECLLDQVQVVNDGPAEVFWTESVDTIVLAPSTEVRLPVYFSPPWTPGDENLDVFTGQLRFEISDPAAPLREIPLRGTSGPLLCVKAAPSPLAFGPALPMCEARERTLDVINICPYAVEIEGLALAGACSHPTENCPFEIASLESLPTPRIRPGERIAVPVAYRPTSAGQDVGAAMISIVDEAEPLAVALLGRGAAPGLHTDVFTQAERPRVDVLWVIDDSAGMAAQQQLLAARTQDFLDFALQEDVDFQVGVTTTDVSPAGARGRLVPLPPTVRPRVISRHTIGMDSHLSETVQVGAAGSATGQGVEAARLAVELRHLADDPSTSLYGDGNAGLVRDDAALSIVFLSEDPDASEWSVAQALQYFEQLKAPDMVRIHGITPGPDCLESTHDTDPYFDLIQASGGFFRSICEEWSSAIWQLGAEAFSFGFTYRLTGVPSCDGICTDAAFEVEVDGERILPIMGSEQIWTHVANPHAIRFNPTWVPPAGSVVKVTYLLQCDQTGS